MRRFIVAAFCSVTLLSSLGASSRSQNFIVSAPTPQLAQEICAAAEAYRRDLAVEWLGAELPPWRQPCPIEAQVAQHLGAGGATSFMFKDRQPFGWTMSIQGSRERVLDSVLPHEITHTIFATHFGRPLPRWADEGACTTVEHSSERHKQERLLVEFLTTNRGIAFNKMFAMKEYPKDILPLYSQGYALARFMILQGGKQKFVQYVGEGMERNNWTAATRKYYGYESLGELQTTWLEWVQLGTPQPLPQQLVRIDLNPASPAAPRGELYVAANTVPANNVAANNVAANNSILSAPPVPNPAAMTTDMYAAVPGAGIDDTTSAGRVESAEGWYARMRDEVRSGGSPVPKSLPPLPPAVNGNNPYRGAAATYPTSASPETNPNVAAAIIPEAAMSAATTNTIPAPPATEITPVVPAGTNSNPFRTATNDRQVLLEWRRSEADGKTPENERRDWAMLDPRAANTPVRR